MGTSETSPRGLFSLVEEVGTFWVQGSVSLMAEGPKGQGTPKTQQAGECFLSVGEDWAQSLHLSVVSTEGWGPGLAGLGGLTHAHSCLQLTNAGDDVVVFYNDKASLAHLLDMMKAARDGVEDHSPLMYHISLVDLLAACAEGKNVYTEIKCTSLLPLEDVVSVVTHEDCITEVGLCVHMGT